jgi:hypothetical protein
MVITTKKLLIFKKSRRMKMSKTYILDIKGICIDEDEFENTTIHICRNGEWCEIPFNKDDIVEIEENEDE